MSTFFTVMLVFWASVLSAQTRNLLTNEDVIRMTRLNFDDTTIIKTIQVSEANFDLSVAALVNLKEKGVSQAVIQAMLAMGGTNKKERIGTVASVVESGLANHQSSDPKAAALKLQPGAYLWTGASWSPLQHITLAGGGSKHIAKMCLPGLTPQMVWTFRDSRAAGQVAEEIPLFCFKFISVSPPYAPSGRDLFIARFDQKKDHRELQTTSGGNLFTFKAGLGKDRMPDIEVTGLDSSTYLVSPKLALAAGEYLLTTSLMGTTGYDFGFHTAKK